MKPIGWLFSTALLGVMVSLPVYAADQAGGNTTTAAASQSMMGEHDMTGTISSIDHKSGVVKLTAKPHDMELHFPPDAIKDLKKGDKITVHLAFRKD